MNNVTTWEELLRPGWAERYFEATPLPPFRPRARAYDPADAWWLAELARLVYRNEGRDEVLAAVGLREELRVSQSSTHCAVLAPDAGDDFAIVAFQGTSDLRDWLTNLDATPAPWRARGRVHKGFARAIESVWDELETWLGARRGPVFYTGHSLGGALATLATALREPRATYTFGAPRVGDAAFARSLARAPLYRVVYRRDVVTTVPPPLDPPGYRHAGHLHYVTTRGDMVVDPTDGAVRSDRREASPDQASWRDLFRPAAPLADHAPVRYVDALRALL